MTDDDWIRGQWMQTYTGKRFYPKDPRSIEVEPEDIGHALSLICRYGGHVERFYSVAEHSVLMSNVVAPEHALAALLHDATEAYVGDMIRPLKLELPAYREIEDSVWLAIVGKFGAPTILPPEVKEADNRILIDERNALLPKAELWHVDDHFVALGVRVEGWLPAFAESVFMDRLNQLWRPS